MERRLGGEIASPDTPAQKHFEKGKKSFLFDEKMVPRTK